MICLHTDTSSWAHARARTQNTQCWKTTHLFSMRNDSSKCYFRTRLKTTFSITIKTSLFNLIWKVCFFFRSFALLALAHSCPLLGCFFTSIWHCVIRCVIIAIQFIKYLFVSFWCEYISKPLLLLRFLVPSPHSAFSFFFFSIFVIVSLSLSLLFVLAQFHSIVRVVFFCLCSFIHSLKV